MVSLTDFRRYDWHLYICRWRRHYYKQFPPFTFQMRAKKERKPLELRCLINLFKLNKMSDSYFNTPGAAVDTPTLCKDARFSIPCQNTPQCHSKHNPVHLGKKLLFDLFHIHLPFNLQSFTTVTYKKNTDFYHSLKKRTSLQKLGRHALHQVRSVWKSLG